MTKAVPMQETIPIADPALAPMGPEQEDEEAATQRSILEELHTISEEVPNYHNATDTIKLEGRDIPELPEEAMMPEQQPNAIQHDEGQPASEDQPRLREIATLPAPTSIEEEQLDAPSTVEASGTMVEEQTSTEVVLASGTAETELTAKVAATLPVAMPTGTAPDQVGLQGEALIPEVIVPAQSADIQPAAEEAVAAPQGSEPLEPAPTAAVEQSEDLVMQEPDVVAGDLLGTLTDQTDTFLDHDNLFDGIDADAFSDIELSPPVRRNAPLPPIDAAIRTDHNRLSASPTRNGSTPRASQLLTDLERAFDKEKEVKPDAGQMASFLDPRFAGFKTLKGKQVKPSEKALAVARKLYQDLEESQDLSLPTASQLLPAASQVSSSQVRPTPVNGVVPAKSILERPPLQEVAPRQTVLISASQGQSPEGKGKATVTQVIAAPQTVPVAPVERQPFATPKPIRSSLLLTSSSQNPSTPTRTPASTSIYRFTTPQPAKRTSLGMMPRVEIGGSTGRKRTLPRFVTPFKSGKRPKADVGEDPASPLRGLNNGSQLLSTPTAAALTGRHYPPPKTAQQASTSNIASASSSGPSVFNLPCPTPRHSLSSVGRPESYSALQMIAKGVPDEVLVILNDASQASLYCFDHPTDGTLLRQSHALDELLARGCTGAKLPWVSNHWSLILWKLAAMVRLDPSCAHEKWSWEEVIRQLLYRYEREVHRAQRSCVKRIQEHDSSPARPMVLFASKVMEEENEVQDSTGAVIVRKSTILELSDGWYRIQAQLDNILAQAIQRGRIRVGQKLAIMGATLDAQGEGNEVLQAYHMSSLKLCANSTSLAKWDARLGFAPSPFVASLRSLTPEGGLISLMDVVITKVYPLAYVDTEKSNGQSAAPRGEQEEAEEKEAWVKRREDAIQRLELQMESENSRLYDLAEALSDLASDSFLPSIPDDPTCRLEAQASTLFDQLRTNANPASAVNELVVGPGHSALAPWLHSMAKSTLLAEDSLGGRLGADLDKLCPPRKVREFRVVRFRDARLPPLPPAALGNAGNGGAKTKNPHAREVQLHVWDAAQFGDELKEGKRFLVANLVPMSKSAWRKPDEAAEVFLSTRRDTKWRPVA